MKMTWACPVAGCNLAFLSIADSISHQAFAHEEVAR